MGFRMFHWVMAAVFLLAYLSGENAGLLHAWLGYGCLLLLGWRVWAAWSRRKGFPAGVNLARLRSSGQWSRGLTLGLLSVMALLVSSGVLMVDNAAVISHGLQWLMPQPGAEALGRLFAGLPLVDAADVHAMLAKLSLWLIGLHIGLLLLFRRPAVGFMLGLSRRKRVETSPPRMAASPAPQPESPLDGARLQVRLYGTSHQLLLPAGHRLLDAMEQHGLQPPCRCRAGMCGACRCKVAQGKVVMHNNLVLSQEEIDDGWILACQAEADAPLLDISFDHAASPVASPHDH
ncbi:2Fe-2S iron-sulfur cluster binding domain-containing protein [Aquitalea denitrificans]|uniref:2Fe-2S iron-sulfur cluster binding domain-containing protein n=1 Tax=Aquitalea denitrificans TaxID=519081 RepID=UPI00135C19C6|nr:2Fe-2S iron-sulfur cluster binding domain-containing protein [Aquitalea denitrificans]